MQVNKSSWHYRLWRNSHYTFNFYQKWGDCLPPQHPSSCDYVAWLLIVPLFLALMRGLFIICMNIMTIPLGWGYAPCELNAPAPEKMVQPFAWPMRILVWGALAMTMLGSVRLIAATLAVLLVFIVGAILTKRWDLIKAEELCSRITFSS